MTSVTRPRGPLPPRVYWTRRLLVLALACALVFGVGRLLGGTPSSDDGPSAQPASAQGEAASETATRTALPTPTVAEGKPAKKSAKKPGRKAKPTKTPLAMPNGPCRDSDVRVAPAMEGVAYAGGDVALTLELRSIESAACTWEVNRNSVAVKVTSGDDRIWTSQECPAAMPTRPVVLRSAKATTIDVTWSGRRSDPDCSRTTLWALPGYYHLSAAAMGAEAQSQQFRLREPAPATITPSPKAKPKKKRDG